MLKNKLESTFKEAIVAYSKYPTLSLIKSKAIPVTGSAGL
jgi:hypothetical protein